MTDPALPVTRNQPVRDREKDRYEACVKALNFELEQFWKRSLFFWGFIGAAFVGLAAANNHPFLQAAIASFGFVGSIVWTLANRGSKFWYEDWERKLIEAENSITGSLYGNPGDETKKDNRTEHFLERKGARWFSGRRFSPSRLTIALSYYTVVFWFGVLSYKFVQIMSGVHRVGCWRWLVSEDVLTLAFMGFSFVFGLLLFGLCHTSKENDEVKNVNSTSTPPPNK